MVSTAAVRLHGQVLTFDVRDRCLTFVNCGCGISCSFLSSEKKHRMSPLSLSFYSSVFVHACEEWSPPQFSLGAFANRLTTHSKRAGSADFDSEATVPSTPLGNESV